jgi:hypothetical protein
MAKETNTIKLGKNGRPIVPNSNPAGAPQGWRGGVGKGPSTPMFTLRRTAKRGDK